MRYKNGFTLIELIVAVSVMMVLLGISYAISGFTKSRKVMSARNEMATHIKLARNLAITNQLPDETTNLQYVRVTISGMTISVVGVAKNGSVFATAPYFSRTIEAKGVTTTIDGGLISSFGFDGISGKLTDSDGNLSDTVLTVDVTEGSEKYSIEINSLGVITGEN
ncbi:prepilin-type N-terminal cleavage/methylation domain-containing protein [Candidatus Shapirobacteria bacterium]|jgi:prepilin-type N-terminal cleavage/methylation domain-containing protein|nr:prepilin-type N-terminal cleavage/methylation domain-containing protein [Candidatus Shapirobacteria bacterium]